MSRSVTVLTHTRPQQVADALAMLIASARRAGVTLRFDEEETRKNAIEPGEGIEVDVPMTDDIDLCVVLGGDGTILRALRRYAGTSVPVFAVNFGQIGFLATIDPSECEVGFDKALSGEFEVLTLPALALHMRDGAFAAVNDLSIHRKLGGRVAQLAYELEGEQVGSVRLANGGPVLAWGVEGYVVSFIAPHSLTARALVVAPGDRLTVHNHSAEPVDVSIDGRPAGELAPDDAITARFLREAADLAQVPGSSFYRRLREKFGLLA